MDDLHGIDPDVLRAQLRARQVMKREIVWFYAALVAGTLVYLVVGSSHLLGILALFLFIAVMRTAMVWYQWHFLRRFGLACPYCHKPLGGTVRYLKSPTHDCPHCGRQALAPISQLRRLEKDDRG